MVPAKPAGEKGNWPLFRASINCNLFSSLIIRDCIRKKKKEGDSGLIRLYKKKARGIYSVSAFLFIPFGAGRKRKKGRGAEGRARTGAPLRLLLASKKKKRKRKCKVKRWERRKT